MTFLSSTLRLIVLGFCVVASHAAVHSVYAAERRILFVGNSLTYVNNLPGAFASLAPPDLSLSVDMIARPGATLSDYVGDPVFDDAIASGRYTDVILQERGGMAFCAGKCAAEPGELDPVVEPTLALAQKIRASGARVYYLGTWQGSLEGNRALEFGERHVAKAINARYIEIGEVREKLLNAYPNLPWTHADGQHPGYATTGLIALRVWKEVFGGSAQRRPCVAGAFLYYHAPKADGVLHVEQSAQPRTCLLSAEAAASFSAAR